jgi:DNA-binding SARP family transcriptional activator
MEFRLLGPVEVLDGGTALPIGGGRQRALLVALLIRPNRVVSADRLIDELWAEHPPTSPDNALQALVSRLRRALGDGRLEHRAGGYVLHLEPDERDLDRFLELRADGKPHAALALWRGPPLADVEFADFAQHEIARLEELRLATLEERIDADLAAGRHRELVA